MEARALQRRIVRRLRNRITSYNVCYTKLLRLLLLVTVALMGDVVNGARRWLSLGGMRFQPSEMIRITSYNVCYTKLLRAKPGRRSA